MSAQSRVIRTYSRRQPTARYESSAALVPAHSNQANVRESRLNDKTLVVDNFDDTFDRLTNGVVVPSPDNSLDGDELAKRRSSVVFDIFKAPLQAKKNAKPKEKGKSKKNLVSNAAGVKRKKVDVGSDDSGSSDQEETRKKKGVKSDSKKSKEKVKRAVKRRKDLSPVEPVVKDTVAVSESADENVSNNIESHNKQSTKTNDNFKKPKAPSRGKKHRIVDSLQASPPKVDRTQSNTDERNVPSVLMEKNKVTEKEASSSAESEKGFNTEHDRTVIPLVLQDIPTENTAHDEDNARENFDEIVESNQSNGTDAIDNFAKPKELPKAQLLKSYSNTLTSTPRMNKIRMPVNIQHLSPIVSDKEKRASVDTKEKSSTADMDAENDQNCEGSNINDNVQVLSEQVAETVKSPTKLDEIQLDAAGVKRKKVDVGSDDSGSSDQEKTRKKKGVKYDSKKSKEKVKRPVKRRKDLSPVEPVVKDTVAVSERADEIVPNNIESKDEQSTKTNDNIKKPKALSRGQKHRIVDSFQASPPKVDRTQCNTDERNVPSVLMEMNKVTENEASSSAESEKGFNTEHEGTLIHPVLQDIPTENTAHDEDNARENFDEIVESSQSNGTDAIDNFAKPKELPKVHLLKSYSNTLTSTPRMNKVRMPVNIQHLSPIVSDKEKRASVETKEKSLTADVDAENDQNCEGSNINDNVQVLSEQEAETVKSSTKLDEIQHDDVEENLELLSQEKIDASQSSQQELLGSNVTNENDNQDERKNGSNSSESSAVDSQDDLIDSAAVVESNNRELLIEIPVVNAKAPENTESFVHSPLMFDDSEWIHLEKSDVASGNDKVDSIQINFSQNFSEKNEENNKPTASLESAQVEPAAAKNKNFDILNESSFYPHDWSNDYDSTYGYDQHKKNLENDSTVDSKVDEVENKNSTSSSEKSNDTSEIIGVSTIDNTEIQSVENHELEKTEHTVCHEGNTIEGGKNKSDNQEEHLSTPSLFNEDDHDSMNVDKDNLQNSQSIIEQSYRMDKSASRVDEPNESVAKMFADEDLDDQSISVPVRPSKRRKTDTIEIMIFNEVDDDTNVQNKEESLVESSESISVPEHANPESADDASSTKPVEIHEIVQQVPHKELQVILSRVNPEDYKSPILSRKKPLKTKRTSRKSKDTDDDAVSKKKKQETATTSDTRRVTRGSVTEDKMQQLYVQYQCKEVIIYAVKLEDEGIELPTRRSLKRKSRENSTAEDSEADSSLTNGGLSEFLSKLKDPAKVATRRKTQKKYDGHLAAISEDQARQSSEHEVGKKVVTWGNDKRVTFNESREDSEDDEDTDRVSQPIFLKPGKSWARSLSIINHFHNGKNLDELAAGRENWRHSVQTVLNMQPEVSVRNHSQDHEETRRESRVSRASSQRESKSMRKSSIATNSRFSMRIIPGGKRSTLTNDSMDSQRISHVSDRSRASRKTSLKIRRDTLIETEEDLIRSAKDIILKRCKQTTYEPFDVCFPDSYIDKCRKIGEGVYGEVFLYENGSEKSVIKIIPIEGDQIVNLEPQKKFHEILSEIIIAEELHKLRHDGKFHTNGFVEVNRIMCLIGKYPDKLIDLWYKYDEQKKSENDCPSMFEKDQLYIALELAHGGQDLEAYTFQNASESYAIFLQTAITLAVAEQSLEFEHRDLHWGNLLISKTEDKHSTYKLDSEEISIPTKGVQVAVIDFTLSRMSYQGCKIFNDLAADPSLFDSHGEYQFDIYRMMRDHVNDNWQQFNPFTNVLWMDYTLDKMITQVRYKRKTTKIHKGAIEDMKALRKEIMKYSSAFDFVTNCKKVRALFDST